MTTHDGGGRAGRLRVVGVMVLLALGAIAGARGETGGGPEFRVSFEKGVRGTAATGRLVVYLVRANSPVDMSGQAPGDGPFFESPQPMFGVDVSDLAAGATAVVGDDATAFPVKLSELPAGRYKVQAVLDMAREDSSWKREPGNLYSKVQMVEVKGSGAIERTLPAAEPPGAGPEGRGVEYVAVRSELLSKFRGREVVLRAGVVLPTGYQAGAAKRYAAVYEVPGFGGDDTGARQIAMARRGGPYAPVLGEVVWITLNPEGPNGHHLFADSDNNGPVAEALVKELIPALEARYPLISEPFARLLRGHSSGGWATLWLALNYPGVFGATWSSSPDPVDFRHFQVPDIYADASMYTRPGLSGAAAETPSYRDSGDARMTIRQENLMEEVVGPRNTSGQQWDSWMAVFGPRGRDGNPAALYDPVTGRLDAKIAELFKRYDISELLRKDQGKYGLIFKQRVRLIVGGEDSYYLNEAVESLKEQVDGLSFFQLPEGEHGYIKVVPGKDHGTIYMTPEMQAIPGEMLEHLRRHGYMGK